MHHQINGLHYGATSKMQHSLDVHDLQEITEIVGEIHQYRCLEELSVYTVQALNELIGSHMTGWNDVPLYTNPIQISDLTPQCVWENTGLYHKVYHLGNRYQMLTEIATLPTKRIFISCYRKNRDFSNREKSLMQLLQPHFRKACLQIVRTQQTAETLIFLTNAISAHDCGIIQLDPNINITESNTVAKSLLLGLHGSGNALPSEIHTWIRNHPVPSGTEPTVARTKILFSDATVYTSIFIHRFGMSTLLLKVDNKRNMQPPKQLPKLSTRESTVMYWLMHGKSNIEIAIILGISRRTVDNHCRSIFFKLGVDNRTSAVLSVLQGSV